MSNAWGITAADVTAADWPDSAALDAATITRRLDAAVADCAAFAPALPVDAVLPDDLPPGWVLAAVLQARDIHNAPLLVGDRAAVGEVYAVRVAPMSARVKALLRPQAGRPLVG